MAMDDALQCFHCYHTIFEETGVQIDGFSPPWQHSLIHYRCFIQLFGSPNGLCSSITESKHVVAVKQPWQHSNHSNAHGQMLLTNQRIDKLSAAHADFASCGMLTGSCLFNALAAGTHPTSSYE
jgi:hypothetical protein